MRRMLIVAALFVLGAAKPVAWERVTTVAPNGAYVLGNPQAKVRLVEYLSYTCNHCATFTREASGPLKSGFVAKGTTAVEFRSAVRDRLDFAAALLARCGGAARFFGNSEAIFASQDELMAKTAALEASGALPETLAPGDALKVIAKGSGLTALLAKRGINARQTEICLADKKAQAVVLAMTNEAWQERKISGTPAFLINGASVGPGRWSDVEKPLRAAVEAR